MNRLETSPPMKSLFRPVFWVVLGVVAFIYFASNSGPPEAIVRERTAAGPSGITAYFASPSAAVERIDHFISNRDWTGLTHYYDLSRSSLSVDTLLDGSYFIGGQGGAAKPFPSGYRLTSVEQLGNSTFYKVTVVGDLSQPGDFTSGRSVSFWMLRSPEGYRLVPEVGLKASRGRSIGASVDAAPTQTN